MDKKQCNIEKGTSMALGMLLFTKGATLLEQGEYESGGVMAAIGLGMILLREKLKFGRWHSVK